MYASIPSSIDIERVRSILPPVCGLASRTYRRPREKVLVRFLRGLLWVHPISSSPSP